jgi:hypothetical protein
LGECIAAAGRAQVREKKADPRHLHWLLGMGGEWRPAEEEDESDDKNDRVVLHDRLLHSALCMPCTWSVQRTGIVVAMRCFASGWPAVFEQPNAKSVSQRIWQMSHQVRLNPGHT